MSSALDAIAPWLLRSKATPPRQLLSVLPRPALVSQLDKGADGALVILEAPGGYGKTCLLSEWRSRREERGETVCWLSVDEDDDADMFLAYLAFSAQMSGVEVAGTNLMNFEFSTEKNALQSVYQLLSLLERHPKPVRLIIDDCERLNENVRQSVMPLLLRRLPENCTLVIASREAVELNTVDIDHRGLVARIGPRQLRFSRQELQQLWGARVTARQLARIEEQTEGWPVLVRLLLSAADIGEFDIRHLDEVSHSDSSITTYFEQKILSRLDPEMRDFLIAASVFEDLPDAILSDILNAPKGHPIREKLDSLEAFVAPISGEEGGYRLHPMMRDYLQHRLENENPKRFCQLQAQAARQYAAQGNHVRAVRHALAGKDSKLLVEMLEATGGLRLWLREGLIEFRPIDRLLRDEQVLASPTAGFMRTIILMKTGKQSEAGALYEEIVARHGDSFADDELLSMSAFACKIMLSIYRGLYISPEEIELFEKSASKTAVMFAGYVLTMKCVSAHQAGNFRDAICHAGDAIDFFRRVGSVYGEFYIHLHLGMVGWLMGAGLKDESAFAEARKLIRRDLSYDAGVKPLLEILKQESEHEQAPTDVRGFQRLSNIAFSLMKGEGWLDIYACALRTLSEKQYFASGCDEALLSLDAFAAFASKNDMLYLADICHAERALLLMAAGKEAQAAACFGALRDFHADPKKYLASAPWRAGEAIGEAALLLAAPPLSRDEFTVWRSYRDLHHERGNRRLACRLGALLAAKGGDETDLAALNEIISSQYTRAIAFCRPELSKALKTSTAAERYVNIVDALQTNGEAPHPSRAGMEGGQSILTDKELTVLRRLATGLSDKEIALQLGVTEHGVRYHLKNIYAKLGAKNRLDAVRKAQNLALCAD